MATYILIGSVNHRSRFFFAGEIVNDVAQATTYAQLLQAGAVMLPTGNAVLDAAAALCTSRRKNRGADAASCDVIMQSALAGMLNDTHEAKGTDLTDTATQTIQRSEGAWRVLPTLGQNGTLTLGVTGAVAGQQIEITRTATGAFTYAIVDGGTGTPTLLTFVASKQSSAKFQFDGTNWKLRSVGTLT
jgi:hypothetical protein